MTDSWQAIIEQQAADMTASDLQTTPCFIPLNELGVLQITGDDGQRFLQNLFTNDVDLLSINQAQLNGFCNAKGRLFAVFILVRRDDGFQLILPKVMCTPLLQRLSMYILRSNVLISDVSDAVACMGLTRSLNTITLPTAHYQVVESDEVIFIKYSDSKPYFLCVSTQGKAATFIQSLQQDAWEMATEKQWQQFEIEQGLPSIYPDTQEKFTPQQVNFDLIGGVSFKKGCYPGQEVVARLHYLGKASRRMFIAQANSNSLPKIGQEVTTEDGSVAGHIVRAQYKDTTTISLLLSLKLASQQPSVFIDNTIEIIIFEQHFPE
ncbi:MAG: YgfZ/GcvT domain-containing protein [Methylophagaceae bacterium]